MKPIDLNEQSAFVAGHQGNGREALSPNAHPLRRKVLLGLLIGCCSMLMTWWREDYMFSAVVVIGGLIMGVQMYATDLGARSSNSKLLDQVVFFGWFALVGSGLMSMALSASTWLAIK